MDKLPNTLILILWMIAFITSAQASHSTIENPALSQAISSLEKTITETMKSQGVPGVAVAIVSQDKVYYLKTYGVRRLGKPDKITPTTLFQIASLSKPLNSTLLAILQDKGKLSLDDPIDRHLPGFSLHQKRQPLKICHLISHSSGIPNHGFDELIGAYAPRDKIVAKLQKTRAVAPPGQHFAYHNAMFGVIDDVIVSASGKPVEQTFKDEMFSPLGMHYACHGLQALLESKNRAYPHIPNGRGKYMPAEQYSKGYYAFLAAGGINASLQDLVPFLQLYLGKKNDVISKKSLNQLIEPFIKNTKAVLLSQVKKGVITDTYYGLGWHSMNYGNNKVIYHQGHLKGFRHFMGYIQDDVGIVILTNAEKKHASKFALSFFDAYVHAQKRNT